ncbi:MAG: hypothetical protein FWE67_16365, partial [Planctomycetaceae bacterium]|nr:hypothetical protein [Planctomycetaceae bacterium]
MNAPNQNTTLSAGFQVQSENGTYHVTFNGSFTIAVNSGNAVDSIETQIETIGQQLKRQMYQAALQQAD